jgi:hypothetical protein
VTVQRLGQSPQHHQNGVREPVIRLKVATLSPTPHHPKVVGLLKMPFPLPDIEVEHLLIRRRLVTAQGISKTTAPNTSEFVLTAEEIKDTVSSTALWLVVREAFGGVGRERKKGKSWLTPSIGSALWLLFHHHISIFVRLLHFIRAGFVCPVRRIYHIPLSISSTAAPHILVLRIQQAALTRTTHPSVLVADTRATHARSHLSSFYFVFASTHAW